MGLKFLLVGILWIQSFCWWVFRGSKTFICGYFVGPIFFLVGPKYLLVDISWDRNLAHWSFLYDTKLRQQHSVMRQSMTLKNLESGECSEPLKLKCFWMLNLPEIEKTRRASSGRGILRINNQDNKS